MIYIYIYDIYIYIYFYVFSFSSVTFKTSQSNLSKHVFLHHFLKKDLFIISHLSSGYRSMALAVGSIQVAPRYQNSGSSPHLQVWKMNVNFKESKEVGYISRRLTYPQKSCRLPQKRKGESLPLASFFRGENVKLCRSMFWKSSYVM